MSASANEGGVVLLCQDGESTRAIHWELTKRFGRITVVMEARGSSVQLLRRRMRTLGAETVAGQVLFALLIVPLLRSTARRRLEDIRASMRFSRDEDILPDAIHIRSVNDESAAVLLRELQPKVVVVSGTRIIGRRMLEQVSAPFINMHSGITPMYRGVHGGYWALVEGKAELAGTTVHIVDAGIDTGSIISQAHLDVTSRDNFVTYPLLHTQAGLPDLVEVVAHAIAGTAFAVAPRAGEASRLRSHPTAWGYMWHRLVRGVR